MLHKRLLFISFLFKPASAIFLFQNISCYCLSAYHVAGMDMDMHFKTSHVIVYHSVCGIVYSGKENFKTSHVIVYLEFRDRFLCKIHYFKTSHVIVYRSICRFLDFKTSHVIVYLSAASAVVLNFIFQNISCYCLSFCYSVHNIRTITFQNISCYCLSETECAACRHKVISKHLMLLFI